MSDNHYNESSPLVGVPSSANEAAGNQVKLGEQLVSKSSAAEAAFTLISLFEQPPHVTVSHEVGQNDDSVGQDYLVCTKDFDRKQRKRFTGGRVDRDASWRVLAPPWNTLSRQIRNCSARDVASALLGSTVFVIYHVVFCLAQAAAITRPHADHDSTSAIAKIAALGVMTAGPVYIWQIGHDIPSLYPSTDLFLAPLLAHLAASVDEALAVEGMQNDDAAFFATFGLAVGLGVGLSGFLCTLAARVKFANLGAFLPSTVLAGFFSTIGILMWTLALSVDTGLTLSAVLGNQSTWIPVLMHHGPSFVIGFIMHLAKRIHPFWVIGVMLGTVIGAYVMLLVTGTTLEHAQADSWFFPPPHKHVVLSGDSAPSSGTNIPCDPSLPFGFWFCVARGHTLWSAILAGLPAALSIGFLYLIRSSLHTVMCKKNAPLVTRKRPTTSERNAMTISQENAQQILPQGDGLDGSPVQASKKRPITLSAILERGYGYSQLVTAAVGGFPVAASLSASLTMFQLGAELAPPQYGSIALCLIFYLTDFTLVQYIPKAACSCLLVLAAFDMCRTWIVGSFVKTSDKAEWLIAPILVVMSFIIGTLEAIFLGVAISTFVFVANMYGAGTVKFVGSGLTLRSTVERGVREASWLNQHADWIQILVLQNYIFFGNAQSVLTYTTTMFEEDDEESRLDEGDGDSNAHTSTAGLGETEKADYLSAGESNGMWKPPPPPKYLILDFSMVSGIDTSAVDVIAEIKGICHEHGCSLLMAGLNADLRAKLAYAGVQPDPIAPPTRSAGTRLGAKPRFAYLADLETALAKAEDGLVSNIFHLEERDEKEFQLRHRRRLSSSVEDGFLYSLRKIDEHHRVQTADQLSEFRPFTTPIELEPGDILIREHGLYFVEAGQMRVRPSLSSIGTMSAGAGSHVLTFRNINTSIGHLNARGGILGRQAALLKQARDQSGLWLPRHGTHQNAELSFRLARVGQGWIIGSIEASSHMRYPGVHVAISHCRLHYLPYSAVQQAEQSNPALAMHLYKLLSLLATKRQESTIQQLGQFVKILNAPTPRLRGGRTDLARLHQQDFYS